MKNKTQVFILLLIMVTLTACRYDEGPMISFRSVEKRVAQSFLLVEFTKNGVDMTQELTDSCGIYWTFKTYRETGGDKNLILNPVQYNVLIGRYGISSNNKNLWINIYAPYGADGYVGLEPFMKNVSTTWELERLKMKEMWLSCTYNNANYYLKLEANED